MINSLPFFLLITMFCINNARRAGNKGLNPVWWILFTIIAIIAGLFIMYLLWMIILVNKNPDAQNLIDRQDRDAMINFMTKEMSQHELLYPALIFSGGYGGYLLVRYLIEKRKDIPKQ